LNERSGRPTPENIRAATLLSIQGALVGAISANVRRVLCRWSDTSVEIRAIFDGTPSEDDLETMSIVETEVMADFPGRTVTLKCRQIDEPALIEYEADEVTVFGRKEIP